MTTQYKILPLETTGRTQVAVNNGDWICICQNTADADGFTPITTDGILTDMGAQSELWRCNSCGRVIMDKTGTVSGTTTELAKGHPKTQKGRQFLRGLAQLMEVHRVKCLTGWDDGRVWLVFDGDTDSTYIEPEPFGLSRDDLSQL